MGAFDDIIKGASEEDKAILAKYNFKPVLDEFDGLKVKYSEADSRLKETTTKLQATDSKLSEWETWKRDNWDSTANSTKTEQALKTAYEQAQERVAALESTAGADMTFEEILGNLQTKGFATKADIDAAVTEKTKGFVDTKGVDRVANNLSAGFEHIYQRTYNLGRRHEKEFGEELEIGSVFKYMGDNKINDPEVAYNQMVTDRRAEAAKKAAEERDAKYKADIEAAKKEGEAEGAKKAAMSHRMPTDQTPEPAAMGHLQRKQMEMATAKKKPAEGEVADTPANVKLGDGVLSNLGYDELLKSRANTSA